MKNEIHSNFKKKNFSKLWKVFLLSLNFVKKTFLQFMDENKIFYQKMDFENWKLLSVTFSIV